MKKLLSLVIALITMNMSMNIFAYTGHDFKILSETIKSSPGFNFRVEETHGKKKVSPYASAITMTVDKQGHVRDHVQIDGYHDISISNYTNKSQIYEYTYILYCENSYGEYTRHVEVAPGGNFSTSDHSIGDVQKDDTGYFSINASTKVSGESNAYHEAHATLRIIR